MVSEEADRPSTRRLVAHAALLWVGLLALMPLAGVGRGPLISDEGALLLQVGVLDGHGGWRAPYPLADLDPDGEWVALGASRYSDGEFSPYASRPAYVMVTAALHRLAGPWGPVALGTLGVALSAAFAGLLTRRLASAGAVPTVWLVGLGTPLIAHGYILQGHSLGAAAAAAVCLLAVRASDRRPGVDQVHLLLIVAITAAACLVRRETVFLAAGLSVWAVLEDRRHRSPGTIWIGLAALAGALIGTSLERLAMAQAFGTTGLHGIPATGDTGTTMLEGRVWATYESLVLPSFDDRAVLNLVSLIGLAVVVVGAAVLRSHRSPTLLVAGLAGMSGAALFRLAVPGELAPMVPGLLMAAPVLVAGLFLVPRRLTAIPGGRLLVVVTTVVIVSVLATQYVVDWNWGGRFFSLALPLLAVISALGWTTIVQSIEGRIRTSLIGAVCLSVMAFAGAALALQHQGRATAADLIELTTASAPEGTLVVTTQAWLPRYDTDQLDGVPHRWAHAPTSKLDALLEQAEGMNPSQLRLVVRRGADARAFVDTEAWTLEGPVPLPTLRTAADLWILSPNP